MPSEDSPLRCVRTERRASASLGQASYLWHHTAAIAILDVYQEKRRRHR
jgi:hypothetical protein